MAKTHQENSVPAKKSSRRVNGVVITLIFFVLDLILFGALGKSGKAVSDFFVGLFGYAVYGYSLALTVLGVLMALNLKSNQTGKIILIYALIVVTTITFAHILSSRGYAQSWGKYISQSYKNADTAGGALASIFLYLFATKHIYVLALVTNGILTVGLIAIAVLLQVDIDVTAGGKRFQKVKGAASSNVSVYDVNENVYAPSLNNQTVKGKNLGDKLFRRGARNRLGDYQPIDSVNITGESQNVGNYVGGYDRIDFAEEYYSAPDNSPAQVQQEDTPLILNTQEVRDEIKRGEYIFASRDVGQIDNSARIGQAQNEMFGIDASQRLNVIDEGAQNVKKRRSPYERFQSDSRSASDFFEVGRTPSYYSQMQNSTSQQNVNDEPSEAIQNDRPTQQLSFGERLNRILSSDAQNNLESFEFPDADGLGGSQNQIVSQNEDAEQSETQEQSAGDVLRPQDIGSSDSQVEQDASARVVEDRTESITEESMDEFIARTNREKQLRESSPVVNYDVKKDIVAKKEVISGDGYLKKTYGKPVAPSSAPQKEIKANIINGKANGKSENAVEKAEEKAQKPIRTPYIAPSLDNLKDYVPDVDENEDYMERARIIERTYANFGIEVHVKNIVSGPSVTRYEFEIPETLSVDKIPSKLNNILMALAVETARIEAPIPGKSLCGIEVPNKVRKTVGLKEFLASDKFRNKTGGLYFALGKDVDNNCHYEDLTDFPHGLIAGGTGSGKSVCLNTMLCSLIYKYSPEELRIILVDPKRVEFGKYQSLPHLLTPKIYNSPKESLSILKWLVAEMERRYALFAKRFVAKISSYNSTQEVIDAGERIPYIVTIIDEVGDIMVSEHAKEFETYVLTLAQKARACGIHLILATQRPSVDVITGNIKANLPTRIAFAVTTGTDSRTILDSIGAEDLLGKGDMLIKTTKSRYMVRLQNPFIDDGEIQNVMKDIVQHNTAYFDETIESEIAAIAEPKKEEPVSGRGVDKVREYDFPDELCPDVLKRIVGMDNVSISSLQRAFSIGFARGGKIFDWLKICGYIEKQGTKFICLLSGEQVDDIIEKARLKTDQDDD